MPRLKLLILSVIVVVLSLGVFSGSTAQSEMTTKVSPERFARLAKGVNFSFWFWYAPDGHFDPRYITDDELQMLKDAGLTHVRLPFDPDLLMPNASNPTELDPAYLAAIDDAVQRILKVGLAVIIDPHPLGAGVSDFRKKIALDDEYLADVALPFYTTYAAHFSTYDPEMLFFETMNEPAIHEFFDGTYDEQVAQGIDRWNVVQPQIAAALRTGAPDHTLIAQGQTWDNIDSLLQTTLIPDDNVIYNFHFYEPFPFTHQGATWTWDCVRSYKGIPYPSNSEVIAPFLAKVPAGECYDALVNYGETRWDQSKVQAMIQQAAGWAETNGVYLTVNEFGAYKTYAPAESRITLLHDMRVSFEHFNIGWTMWDFNGGFDLVDERKGSRSISSAMADALGLEINPGS